MDQFDQLSKAITPILALVGAFLTGCATSASSNRVAAISLPYEQLDQTFGNSYADWRWWARVCPKVVVPKEALPETRTAAEKLAKAFGASVSVADDSPQPSSIWIEVRDFAPKSFAMGYVIIHSSDGTQISAWNQYWLDAAVERFIKSSRMSNGYHEAPFGLTTSFNLAITPHNEPKSH